MTTPQYSSGEAVQPGDKVLCGDGVHGRVVFTVESSKSEDKNQGFVVERSDDTTVHYQPLDHGVKFVWRAGPKISQTVNETIKKEAFLVLLKELGSHSLYYPEMLVKKLSECGLSASLTLDGKGIVLEGQLIPVSSPEWGEPGISPLNVLSVVYEIATGESPRSDMNGRGFWYQEVMDMLAEYWETICKE